MSMNAIIMMAITMVFYIGGFAICLNNVFKNEKNKK